MSTDSWIDSFVSDAAKYTDAPYLYLKAAGYFILGAACEKKVHYRRHVDGYGNLFIILVAPPNRCRKSTVYGFVNRVLREGTFPAGSQGLFMPHMGSDSAYFDAMAAAPGGCAISMFDEFSNYINMASSDAGKKMEGYLLEYYYPSTSEVVDQTRSGGRKAIPKGTILSFFAGCQNKRFIDYLSNGVITSGLMSRFVTLCPMKEDMREPFRICPEMGDEVVKKWVKTVRSVIPRKKFKIPRSSSGNEAMMSYIGSYDVWKTGQPPKTGEATTRFSDHLERLAMIHAVSRESDVITDQDVDGAYEDILSNHLSTMKNFTKFSSLDRHDQVLRMKIFDEVLFGPKDIRTISINLNEEIPTTSRQVSDLIEKGELHKILIRSQQLIGQCNGACRNRKHKEAYEAARKAMVKAAKNPYKTEWD